MSSPALMLIDQAFHQRSAFLDLGNCGLSAIPPEIEKVKDFIESLNLGPWYREKDEVLSSANKHSKNDFSGADLQVLTGFKKLKVLTVNACGIGSAIENIVRIRTLSELEIGGNELTEDELEQLAELVSLTRLNVAMNTFGDRGALYLSRLSGLTHLTCSYNNITDRGAAYISRLSSLSYLDLSSNRIGDEGAEYISKLTSMTRLNLFCNKLGEWGGAITKPAYTAYPSQPL